MPEEVPDGEGVGGGDAKTAWAALTWLGDGKGSVAEGEWAAEFQASTGGAEVVPLDARFVDPAAAPLHRHRDHPLDVSSRTGTEPLGVNPPTRGES